MYIVHWRKAIDATRFDTTIVDAEALRLIQRENIQGLSLAIIEGDIVSYVSAYGWRNVKQNLPLTTDTIMYGASLTKTAFAYMVLQLVDEGMVDLDVSIAKLLPRPLPGYDQYADLQGDERWRALTPRILLTHTSGFANFRWFEADRRLRFHFYPGSRYSYSGEGFQLLQFALEQGLALDVEKEMQTRIFDRFGITNTSMVWRPDFAVNLADGYDVNGAMVPHRKRRRAGAAGSMDTSIADQARMWASIVRGDGLSSAMRADLIRPQVPITAPSQFPTLTTQTEPRNAEIGLAAGLGLVTFQDTSGPAWFKGGHDDGTGNMVICLEQKKRCLVMLSNDVRAERIYSELAQLILGVTKMPWNWEYDWLEKYHYAT